MSENENDQRQDKKQRIKRERYRHRSPAVCIVAYDIGGKNLSDATVRKVEAAVLKATEQEKLAVSVTRT